jgi:tartrate dehydratase beta subunit/fumarate hydratase class I family protein
MKTAVQNLRMILKRMSIISMSVLDFTLVDVQKIPIEDLQSWEIKDIIANITVDQQGENIVNAPSGASRIS